MKRTIRCDPHAPATARQQITDYLKQPEIPGELINDVVLAASELVTNAVDAGATSIELSVDVIRHEIALSVADDTGGWPTLTSPNPYATRGRGLAIVEKTADNWNVERTPHGKKVTAHFATNRAGI